jgi:hypothetical protein
LVCASGNWVEVPAANPEPPFGRARLRYVLAAVDAVVKLVQRNFLVGRRLFRCEDVVRILGSAVDDHRRWRGDGGRACRIEPLLTDDAQQMELRER